MIHKQWIRSRTAKKLKRVFRYFFLLMKRYLWKKKKKNLKKQQKEFKKYAPASACRFILRARCHTCRKVWHKVIYLLNLSKSWGSPFGNLWSIKELDYPFKALFAGAITALDTNFVVHMYAEWERNTINFFACVCLKVNTGKMLKSKNESTYQPNSEIFHLNPKPEVLQQNDEMPSVGLNNDPFFLNCLLREGKRIFNQEKEEPVDKSMFSKSESTNYFLVRRPMINY